jgi:hypothetical protein
VGLLRDRAAERAFASDPDDPARSAAQVLHYRLARDVPYRDHGDHRPDLLPGWVTSPPAADTDDVDPDHLELADWLRHRATRIAERVHVLGVRAADATPSWTSDLGDLPDDPLLRELWIHRAGQVAAYRERWHVADDLKVMLPPCDRGEQGRARQWVVEYLSRNPLPTPVVGEAALDPRTTRIRSRLDLLRTQMASTPTSSTDTRPTPDQEVAIDDGPGTAPEMDLGP